MKQFYFLLIILTLSTLAFSQTEGASKLYGYRQAITPGTIRVDKNGNQVRPRPNYNYFIYLASSSTVSPAEIWINGQAYSVTSTAVSNTPVEYKNPTAADGKSKILVPKTNKRVVQLSSSSTPVKNPTKKGQALSAKNELVIIYKGQGKLYYKTVSKFSELEAISMQ
jgi:hypothetical protein